MDEKTIKSVKIPTVEEILSQINTQPLNDAISAFIDAWREAAEKVADDIGNLYQAILDMIPSLSDVCIEVSNTAQKALEIIKKRDCERRKWRAQKAVKIRPLLLDKRSKIHRCRNAC